MHLRDYKVLGIALRKAKKDNDIDQKTVDKIINDLCLALKAEASSFNETKFRSYIEKGE
jgi:hypothetical protein